MGLNIRLYGINSPKAFTLSYKIGKTSGNESVIATGYTSYGSLYPASSSRNYTTDPIIFTNASFDTQYWFKLTYTGDTGDVNYIIENIFTNEAEVYDNCINYCYFPNVGSALYVAPTPTPSPTPSPTPNCNFSGGSAVVVIGPTPTPNPTATPNTPTATPTPTTSPTPTPTTNVVIDPSYYYYAMGDCNDMRYSGTERTVFGFGAPLVLPVCMSSAEITQWYSTANFAQQTLNIDYNDPCGFGQNYSGVAIARSSTQLTEGTVYQVGNSCLSIIAVQTQYVTGYTYNLDGVSAVAGANPCSSCDPPFTGFTVTGYSGVTCDTGENIVAYSIIAMTTGRTYGIQLYEDGLVAGNSRCMTINANLGPQLVITDPAQGFDGYQITDSGPFILGQTMFQGYADCTSCNSTPRKYMITGERCDNASYSVTVWSATQPTLQVNNTFKIDGSGLTTYCWKATQVDQYTSAVYLDLGFAIVETGCNCNGNNGGGSINVANIDFAPSSFTNTGGECQSPQSSYYTESTSTQMLLTFRDSSNNPVTPNDTVQYRVNGGTWVTLTVTSSTVSFPVTLIYGDNTNCSLGGSYADTLDIKVGTITVEYFTAGSA